ncbi:hypothetical protein [Burkholderia sp. Bp8992]|uniref:hypothetical protein n=1 Tax=Burkholderia sp. Bp8992 TaxID=2184554 RepID=UPI000F561929|nr:hypothetical protein [Burkholderia sp. Bp8992]
MIKVSGGKETSAYVREIKIDRIYPLLSEKETARAYFLGRCRSIIDIREHRPILDRDRILQFSQQCDVRHPFHDGAPEPFTLNFLVTELMTRGLRSRCQPAVARRDPDAVATRALAQQAARRIAEPRTVP